MSNKDFNEVTISNLTTQDGQGFSRMTTATTVIVPNPVPEPSILALVALGLGLVGGRLLRRA